MHRVEVLEYSSCLAWITSTVSLCHAMILCSKHLRFSFNVKIDSIESFMRCRACSTCALQDAVFTFAIPCCFSSSSMACCTHDLKSLRALTVTALHIGNLGSGTNKAECPLIVRSTSLASCRALFSMMSSLPTLAHRSLRMQDWKCNCAWILARWVLRSWYALDRF